MHHERLIAAVAAHDASAAKKAMQEHLRDSQRILVQGLQMEADQDTVGIDRRRETI
jgi:DNA-binding GntR family transcriptional regulator